jgi:hypothetical protein
MKKEEFLEKIQNEFLIRRIKGLSRISSGNVNSTLRVEADGANYVLQKINKFVFKNPEDIMQNIRRVSRFLEKKVLMEGGDPTREVLHPINTLDGSRFFIDDNGQYWRMYNLIEGAVTYDTIDNAEMFYKVGKAFGKFQNRLADYDMENEKFKLHEAIPDIHNTPKRFMDFQIAMLTDKVGRLKAIEGQPNHPLKEAIDYILSQQEELSLLEVGKRSGKLPTRVTHNDTKINNVMIDKQTGEPICIIDLDTIGPDTCLVDFGDAIRSGANRAGEEPENLTDAKLDLDLFKAYTKGYLSQTLVMDSNGNINQDPKKGLIKEEISLLHKAPKILAMELAMRFIGDYLNGDEYFQLKDGQPADINLRRGLAQMYLAQDMSEKENEMKSIVEAIINPERNTGEEIEL